MWCPRLSHYVKIRPRDQKVDRCCSMSHHRGFNSLEEMESSEWLVDITAKMARDEWPDECSRCRLTEEAGLRSIRMAAISKHEKSSNEAPNYLNVNVDLDTLCNAACQFCSPNLSSFYADLRGISLAQNSGLPLLRSIDPDRITTLSVSGGEASFSPAVREFISTELQSFNNLRLLDITTNGSIPLTMIEPILASGMKVFLDLSMDSVDSVFEYNRFPIKWPVFEENIIYYTELRHQYPNLDMELWGTWNALSAIGVPAAIEFATLHGIKYAGAFLVNPPELNIHRNNFLTRKTKEILLGNSDPTVKKLCDALATEEEDTSDELLAFIHDSDTLRGIQFNDHYRQFGITI